MMTHELSACHLLSPVISDTLTTMDDTKRVIFRRTMTLTPRKCASCGKDFYGWGRQRFCSPRCQKRWDYHEHAEQRRAAKRERYRRDREGRVSDSR